MCYNLVGADRLNMWNLKLFCFWQQPEVGWWALQMHPDRSKYFEKKEEAFDRNASYIGAGLIVSDDINENYC